MDRSASAPVESLESRRLMSSVALSGRTLAITGLADAENTIAVGFGRGQVHTIVNGDRQSFSLAGLKQITITGGDAMDVVKIDPSVIIPVRIQTLAGDDAVTGGSSNDTIETGEGNDLVYAGGGNDAVNSGNGDDRVYGQDGADSINGGGGSDKLFGNGGKNVFLKVQKTDRIYGGTGLDTVTLAPAKSVSATPAVKADPAAVSLSLVNADTGAVVGGYETMTGGMTLDLAKLPAHLSVRANLSGGSSTAVRFDLDRTVNFRTERSAPFALAGDMSGKFKAIQFSAGTHTITANALANGQIVAVASSTFNVVPKPTTTPNMPASEDTAARPTAVIKAIARTVPAGTSIHVDALSSTLKGGNWNDGSYVWNFGDDSGAHNTMRGFNAAHVYDTPGVYAVNLTVTNAAGRSSTTALEFTITASGRNVIYVAANGNDKYDGLSTSRPVQSLAKALTLVDDNTEILFRRGDTFGQTASFRISSSNVVVGAYGSGKQPKIVWTGTRTNDVMFFANVGTTNVTVQDLSIDTIFSDDTGDSGTPMAFKMGGTNFTARRNTLLNLQYAFMLNMNPTAVNIQDNTAPLATGLRKYFAWVQGNHVTIAGNLAANSTREHIVRVNFASMLNVSENDFTNLSRREIGDYWDYRKTAVNVQSGEFAYIYGNRLDGSFQVGPLGQTEGMKGQMSAAMRFKYAVGEANEIVNDQIVINHGAEHVTLRDNTIKNDGLLSINVDGYNDDYQRGVVDLVIRNNTAINNNVSGSFLRVYGAVDGIQLLNNVYVAPNLAIGLKETAVIKMEPDALSSFTKIDGNVWPTGRSTASWIHEMGINYIGTGYTASGFYTADEWNALKTVGTDTFQTVTSQQAGTLVLGGVKIGARRAA